MHLISMILVAVALSLDAFFAGTSFGMRRIGIPYTSALLVGAISGCVVFIALLAGRGLAMVLPPQAGPWLGGLMLIAVGIWILGQDHGQRTANDDPDWPDFDRSGHISPWEAIWLGAALALDAFGAGMGVGLGGWAGTSLPAAVAAATTGSLMAGVLLGARVRRLLRSHPANYLPGAILIIIGLTRLLGLT